MLTMRQRTTQKTTQLTVRGVDVKTLQVIRELAKRERISINKAALKLLEKGAGVSQPAPADRIGNSLDHLIGTWTEQEAKEFDEAIKWCEVIDPDHWK